MDDRSLESKQFLSTPEGEARFWALVAVAVFIGIGMVMLIALPTQNPQVASNDPGFIERMVMPPTQPVTTP